MSFVEFDLNALALNPRAVSVITRVNKTVSFFINGTAHDVVYVDQIAAIAAYNAFIAFKNLPRPINIGDVIKLRGMEIPHKSENLTYTVTNVPDIDFPWWAILGAQTNTTYVIALGDGMLLELVPPP
jgi:hypothetical protein